MTIKHNRLSRRALLRRTSLAAAAGCIARAGLIRAQDEAVGHLQSVPDSERRLLFVFCAYGGASIIDSFLPVTEAEVGNPFSAATLNVFPEGLVEQQPGSSFRNVRILEDYGIYGKPTRRMADFVAANKDDMAVITHEVSSVNHTVGQQRSLNGNGVNRGRTLMEAMALRYGGGLSLPNINMASEGYLRHGADDSLPSAARHEVISAPRMFGAATHGFAGTGVQIDAAQFARARATRDMLDETSPFGRTFTADSRRNAYLHTRGARVPDIERDSLVSRLLLLNTGGGQVGGLDLDPATQGVREVLSGIDKDVLQAQVGLAFLAAYHGVSTSATIGLSTEPYITPAGSIDGSPIAFDFSHASHRSVQSLMWHRSVDLLGSLITLLKTHDYRGDPSLGKMWDRSLIYVATEFGRDKIRPSFASDWGTGHNLNNGSLLISPLLKGNKVYGGVNPETCETYGCDMTNGEPTPGKNNTTEDVYGIIAEALDLDSPSTGSYPAIVRARSYR